MRITVEVEGHAPVVVNVDASAPQPAIAESTPSFNWHPANASRDGVLFPILHHDIWDLRNKVEGSHWTAKEISMTQDAGHWAKMDPSWRLAVKYQLAFFATIDGDVLDNIDRHFIEEINCLEAKCFYASQAEQECVHMESYAVQIATLFDGAEREQTFRAVRTMPSVGRMRDWVVKWSASSRPIAERLVAFAAIEGVLFCASFCVLQWLREHNLLPGITGYNEFISRDEWTHTQFSCLLVRQYATNPPPATVAHEIMESIVDVIDGFVADALPGEGLPGLTAPEMNRYVRFQADSVLGLMGYPPVWQAINPFEFMDKLALNHGSKTNFFERKGTQYQSVQSAGQAEFALAPPADEDSEY